MLTDDLELLDARTVVGHGTTFGTVLVNPAQPKASGRWYYEVVIGGSSCKTAMLLKSIPSLADDLSQRSISSLADDLSQSSVAGADGQVGWASGGFSVESGSGSSSKNRHLFSKKTFLKKLKMFGR